MTNNEEIARAFDEIADLLEIGKANPFRVRAYRHAARTLRSLGREVGELVASGEDLTRLPGIGKDLAAKIEEMLESGKVKALDKLHKVVPIGVEALLQIPGLGPKRVKSLYHSLGIESVKQLEQAVRDGRVRALPGFGPGIERNILAVIEAHREIEKRFLRAHVKSTAEALVTYLKQASGVKNVVLAGSYLRGRETVGDLDILVTTSGKTAAMEHFVSYEEADEVLSSGTTRATVILRSGLQVDLRVVAQQSFGAVHSQFHLPRDKQTERLLRAMDRPCFTLLAHPSGRLLQKREAYDVDMARIIRQARARGCFLELNSQPLRLDLNEFHCRMAHDEEVLVSINSDAHAKQNFNYLKYGIDQARRGWLETKDVLNTLPFKELQGAAAQDNDMIEVRLKDLLFSRYCQV